MRRHASRLCAQASALIADRECETPWRRRSRRGSSTRVGAPQRNVGPIEELSQVVPSTMKSGVQEMSAHCATDDFGVPQVNGARKGNGGGDTESGGSANQRSGVARILNGIQDENSRRVGTDVVTERAGWRSGYGENALRGFGFGGGFELGSRYGCDFDAACGKCITDVHTARAGGELGRREHSDDLEWRARQLLDGANAFDDEEVVLVASFSAPEIAR